MHDNTRPSGAVAWYGSATTASRSPTTGSGCDEGTFTEPGRIRRDGRPDRAIRRVRDHLTGPHVSESKQQEGRQQREQYGCNHLASCRAVAGHGARPPGNSPTGDPRPLTGLPRRRRGPSCRRPAERTARSPRVCRRRYTSRRRTPLLEMPAGRRRHRPRTSRTRRRRSRRACPLRVKSVPTRANRCSHRSLRSGPIVVDQSWLTNRDRRIGTAEPEHRPAPNSIMRSNESLFEFLPRNASTRQLFEGVNLEHVFDIRARNS